MRIPNNLLTSNLILRPFNLNDAEMLFKSLQDDEIYNNIDIPYPYTLIHAKDWINSHSSLINKGEYKFAITVNNDNNLIGAIGITVCKNNNHGKLGYWITKKCWGQGYATEAVAKMIEFGFNNLKLNKIYADYISSNLKSEKVLIKNKMHYEACLRQHIIKFNTKKDLSIRSIFYKDWINE